MVRFLTYNIRYDNPEDGQDRWENRRRELVDEVLDIKPEIFGLQEALETQIFDVLSFLNEKENIYSWVGVGRDPNSNSNKNEYNPIFYNRNKFQLLNWGTYWLSDTPDVAGSRYQNAYLPRIVTWAQFQRITDEGAENEKTFFFFNTHFSHTSTKERQLSSQLLLRLVSNTAQLYPAILLGDFNCESDSEEYKILAQSYFKDAKTVAQNVVGSQLHSFTGFTVNSGNLVGMETIDYIFVSGFAVEHFEMPNHFRNNNRCISDHRCLFIDAEICV